MNNVVLMGRLTRDPDVRYSQSEQPMAIARYTLAVDRRFKRDGEQTADFISCVSFGRTGEFVEKYLRQGTKVVIRGRIQTGTTDVVAEDVEFAESKNSSQNSGGNGGFQSFDHNPAPSAPAGDGFMNIPDGIEEELPFN
jgi:single-strand DNA-binding protein